MKKVIIDVPFKKLSVIAHMADLHVRLTTRHNEYRLVFDKLYKQLKSTDLSSGIIFVGGDVLHSKSDMSPEMITIVSEFLNRLADIAPTLLIAGNHDATLNNKSRMDSLTPIVNNINHKNLHYLRNSGVYTVADTDIGVFSIFGSPNKWPKASDLSSNNKIAFVHAPVLGSLTEVGYEVGGEIVTPELFNGFDIVMCGDVHLKQTIQEYREKKGQPIIQMPGSLIIQNFGESPDGHGWCEWNLDKKDFIYHEIENDYSFFTVNIKDGEIVNKVKLTSRPRIRVLVENTPSSEVTNLLTKLTKGTTPDEISISNVTKIHNNSWKYGNITVNLTDIYQSSHQNLLIKDYLSRKYSLDDDIIDEVLKLNIDTNKSAITSSHKVVNWKPLELRFNNMFSYADGNSIDFSSMKGTNGIFAPNTFGKSSSMEVLLFALFDKTPRAFKASAIMNNEKNTFECELDLLINGKKHTIIRTGTRKKTGDVKVDVDFWTYDEKGKMVSLNGVDRRDTNSMIREFVGDYEEFSLMNYSSQTNPSLFIDKTQSERKDLLTKLMGLNIFDELHELADVKYKEMSSLVKAINTEDFIEEIRNLNQHNDEMSKDLTKLEKKKKEMVKQIESMEDDYHKLISKKVHIDFDYNFNPDNHNRQLQLSISELEELKQKNVTLLSRIATLDKTKDAILQKISTLDVDDIKTKMTKRTNMASEVITLESKLSVLRSEIQNNLDKLKILKNHKYDPNCKFCMNNEFVKDAQKTEKILQRNVAEADGFKQILDFNKDEHKKLEYIETIYSDFKELYKELNSVDSELLKLSLGVEKNSSRRESILALIAKIESELANYETYKLHILSNKELEVKENKLKNDISSFKSELRLVENDIQHVYIKTESNNSIRIIREDEVKKYEELEKQISYYEYYMESIDRNGIPYELIVDTLPMIETEINNVLSQMVDFRITLDMDGKNINAYLVYSNDKMWPLEMSSGMERFVSSIAIRSALMKISNLPKSNFLIIDEGISVIDSNNMSSLPSIFNHFNENFDFIILISHLEVMRDLVDEFIEINKVDGYSLVNF